MEKVKNVLKLIGGVLAKPYKCYKNLKKPVKRIVSLILVAAIAIGGYYGWKWFNSSETSTSAGAGTSIVRMGNVVNSITGSGTVEPIEQREIVPEVNGKIIESPFEEGAEVKTGDVLYRFEMTAATNAIKTAENRVEKARTTLSNRENSVQKVRENIEKLTVVATESGKVSGLSLLVGEEASGKICTITNFKEQTATIPFSAAQIDSIRVGDSADVAIDKYMINTTGTVVRKYTAPDTLSSGARVYYVEIRLSDEYTVEENVNVTATVNAARGSISSASYGSVKFADPVTVNAEQKGEVKKVNFKNGDWVNEGEIIAVLENSDLQDELKTAQQNYKEAQMDLTEAINNLEDKQEEANEYIVTSPIDGVILTKDYFVGDTISGQNSTTMMVVADMSKMKFTISADELDIAKIQLGQSVSVTADALENQRLVGTITAVSKLGSASNGVTNYPIEVTIDDPGDLMPGMNVSAQIIVEQSYNSLYLPVEAVEYFDGKYYVTVVGEVENMPEPMTQRGPGGMNRGEGGNNQDSEGTQPENAEQLPDNPGGEQPQRAEGERPNRGERPQSSGGGRPEHGERPQHEEGENSADIPAPLTPAPEQGKAGKSGAATPEVEKPETEKPQTEDESDKKDSSSEENRGNRGGGQQQKQEELKIKYYDKEQRVEVKIGITTDTSYEILEGVSYGQVVKNTVQTTSSSSNNMRGGMGGFGGGMGGFGGGMGGNRGGNRSGGMGGRR